MFRFSKNVMALVRGDHKATAVPELGDFCNWLSGHGFHRWTIAAARGPAIHRL